jgi:DNA-binding SARP family transcriptional activator/WD40 repeat protein
MTQFPRAASPLAVRRRQRVNDAVTVQYRTLGPLVVEDSGGSLPLGGPKQRLVLALLLVEPDRVVHLDRLVDGVWEDRPPGGAAHNIQGYVSELRRVLPDAITFQSGGYRLHVDPTRIDARRFESLVENGRKAGTKRPEAAASALRDALAIWRGEPFADLRYAEALQTEIGRLEARRLSALELRLEADLALGRHRELVDELLALTREHPFQERFWADLMLALHRSGRRAEALHAFERARRALAQELGVEPSPELVDLRRRVADADPSLMPATLATLVDVSAAPPVRGFELRQRIGAGRIGVVYAAYQASLGREVAVKVLAGDIAGHPSFVRRFDDMTRRVARLEHPNIVPLLDAWRDPGGAYLVMPLLSGGDLATSLRDGAWQVPASLRLVDQVGSALAHAHRAGIIHGDLDASDVLLDAEGNAFISDLGLQECIGPGRQRYGTGRARGAGAGHEENGQKRDLAVAPDLARLGLLAYSLLTGLPSGQDLDGDVSVLRPEVPREVDQLLRRAVSPEPEVAPTDIDDFLRSLRRAFGVDGVGIPLDEADEAVRDPYKGLRAFDEGDAADFFGRDAAIALALERTGERRLTAIVGSSGGGKSSLVRAGIMPALRRGALPGSGDWLITTMVPGPFPFDELARALRQVAVIDDDGVSHELEGSEDGLLRVVDRLLPPDTELLLVVDQLEEVFSMSDDRATRSRFLASLARAAAEPGGRVHIVVTARADFFDRLLDDAALSRPIREGAVLLSLPSPDELTLAITAPARRAGLRIEPGLAERIVADVSGRPGALPLMQHALTELVRARSGRTLTHEAYEAAGGALGALGNRAEQLYASLGPAVRAVARDVLMRLAAVDEDGTPVRRRAAVAELLDLGLDRRYLEEVLQAFGAYRFLTFDRDPVSRGPTVEVAHEALFSQWSRLASWIDTYRDGLRLQRRLAFAAAEWDEAGRDPSYGLSGGRLAEFEDWAAQTDLPLSVEEREYLDISRARVAAAATSTARRRRLAFGTLTVLTIIAVLFGAFGLVSARTAEHERTGSLVRALVGQSAGAAAADPDLSILLAAEAVKLARSTRQDLLDEAEGRLHASILGSRLVRSFEGQGEVAWSPDGQRLAFITDFGIDEDPSGILIVDMPSGETVRYLPAPDKANAIDVGWTPDGQQVVVTYNWYDPGAPDPYEPPDPRPDPDPVLSAIWDVATGQRVATLETAGERVRGPIYSKDGQYIAAVDSDGLTVWASDPHASSHPGEPVKLGEESGPWTIRSELSTAEEGLDLLGLPAFDPTGQRIAVGAGQEVRIVDAETGEGETLGPVAGRGGVVDVAWAPDGRSVAALSGEGGGAILSVVDGRPPVEFGGRGIQSEVEWSPDGHTIVVAGQSGTLTIWDPESGEMVDELGRHASGITGLDASPDGRWLASADSVGEVRVWAPKGSGREVATFDSDGVWMQSAVWTADERYVVGQGLDDRLIRAWTSDGGPPRATMDGLVEGSAFPVVASPDAGLVAVSGPDFSIVMVDADTLTEVWQLPSVGRPYSFSSDGRYLAGGYQGTAFIIDTGSGRVKRFLAEPDGSIDSVQFLRGDDWVLVVDSALGSRLRKWQDDTTVDLAWRGGTVAISPDRTSFAIGGNGLNQPETRVWDAAEFLAGHAPEPIVVQAGLPTEANSVVKGFTRDGSQVMTGFFDRQLTFWDVETGAPVRHIPTGSVPGGAQVSVNGRHLLVAGDPTRILTLDTDELLAIARERTSRTLTAEECREYLRRDTCP